MLVVGKEANTLSTLHRIANCVKNRARKIVSSIRASRSLQCRPHLLSVKFENLVHRFSRNENSNLEINVSRFELLRWQQWQPPASAPVQVRPIYHVAKSKSFFLPKRVVILSSNYLCLSFMLKSTSKIYQVEI